MKTGLKRINLPYYECLTAFELKCIRGDFPRPIKTWTLRLQIGRQASRSIPAFRNPIARNQRQVV